MYVVETQIGCSIMLNSSHSAFVSKAAFCFQQIDISRDSACQTDLSFDVSLLFIVCFTYIHNSTSTLLGAYAKRDMQAKHRKATDIKLADTTIGWLAGWCMEPNYILSFFPDGQLLRPIGVSRGPILLNPGIRTGRHNHS